mgnify:CR=1 FL=1
MLSRKFIRWLILLILVVFGLLIIKFINKNSDNSVTALSDNSLTQSPMASMTPRTSNISPNDFIFQESELTRSEVNETPPMSTATPTPPTLETSLSPTITAVTEIPEPMNALKVPSDVRVSLLLGTDTESPYVGRTDTIILVFYNPKLAKASLLSIPRDLFVYIPGHNMDRINKAYPLGGIDLLQKTLKYNLDVEIDNWLLVHFNDFVNFINDLGGVDIYISQYIEDEYSSIPPGYHHLDGHQAFWYINTRKNSSDIDRIRRQHEMIKALAQALLRGGNLVHLPEWYAKYSKSIVTNLNLIDLIGYIPLAVHFGDQTRMEFKQIGWDDVTAWRTDEGASVLVPKRESILSKLTKSLEFVLTPSALSDLSITLAAELTASPTQIITPDETPNPSPTITVTMIKSPSPSPTIFITATQTPSPSPTFTNPLTETPSLGPTISETSSITPSLTPNPTLGVTETSLITSTETTTNDDIEISPTPTSQKN